MHTRRRSLWIVVLALAAGLGARAAGGDGPEPQLGPAPHRHWSQLREGRGDIARPERALVVDTQNRADVVAFFDAHYTPPFAVAMGWTGQVTGCLPGTNSQAYTDATIELVNYYRAMTRLPGDVVNDATRNDEAQAAALIMIAQGALSHNPPPTWTCYSPAGALGASSSNLALGIAGPSAIAAYMQDGGTGNNFVGHRRWILYPRQVQMGTGSTDAVNGYYHGSNALWVFSTFGTRPPSPAAVAWPPAGFVPYQVVYGRWSLSLNDAPTADYLNATVTMTEGATSIGLTVVSRTDSGYGDNTIVWEPAGLSVGPGQADRTLNVTVGNILVGGVPRSVSYQVTVIDPAIIPDLIFSDGFE